MARILVMTGLSRRYGDIAAVDALDLAVDEGEVFGVLGRNGAGKTTPSRTPPRRAERARSACRSTRPSSR